MARKKPLLKRVPLRRHFRLLSFLARLPPEEAPAVIDHLDPEAIEVLRDCVHSCLHRVGRRMGPIDRARLREKLSPSSKDLLAFLRKKTASSRRRAAAQLGGSITAIVAALIPVIASLLVK